MLYTATLIVVTAIDQVTSISFFFLMIRRLTISTLFPYTTLFRSQALQREQQCSGVRDRILEFAARIPGCDQDRKSTRLNSSHANISYAVFCLKKKKIAICRPHTLLRQSS